MKILFAINHPAQFHFFKNIIDEFKSDGHRVDIFARDKDALIKLLEHKRLKFFMPRAKGRFLELVFRQVLLFCKHLITR